LLINDFNQVSDVIDDLKKAHLEQKGTVDFTTENRRYAIYVLQGGSLTALNYAYEFNLKGYVLPILQQHRMIAEIVDLILFFDEIDDGSRQVKAFFKNKTIGREPGNTGNLSYVERAKNTPFNAEQIKNTDELLNKVLNISSKLHHPTLDTLRSNLSMRTHIFDYDNLLSNKPHFGIEIFWNLLLLPVIHGLLLPENTMELTKEGYDKLYGYMNSFRFP